MAKDKRTYIVLTAGPDDSSPVHKHWEHGQYSEECFGCWAGYAHTVNYHEEHKAKQ